MRRISLLGAMVFSLACASYARAEIIFNPALTYSSEKIENNGTTISEESVLSADIKLGYLMPTGLYLGGFYNFETSSAFNQEDTNASSLAASVGYFNSGFLAMLSYHFMASRDATPTTTYKKGSGLQLDFAYVLPVTQSFSLGPQLRWRSVTYDELESGATTVSADLTYTQVDPMVSLWFVF